MSICRGCNKLIVGFWVNAMGAKWHPDCLKCPGCRKSIKDEYVVLDDLPWHPVCAQKQAARLCSVCRNPLTKRYFVDFFTSS